jgi:hypothetical protein
MYVSIVCARETEIVPQQDSSYNYLMNCSCNKSKHTSHDYLDFPCPESLLISDTFLDKDVDLFFTGLASLLFPLMKLRKDADPRRKTKEYVS